MRDDTKLVTAGRHPELNHGIVNPPVYHASTVISHTYADWQAKQEMRAKGERGIFYGRWGTPTQFALEDALVEIEGGARCMLFSSGLAAITAALTAFVDAGDHILMVDSAYGPAHRYCDGVLKRFGVETTYYDPLIGAGIAELIRDNTRIVYTESPGSLTFEVQDIPAIAEAAHARGCTVMMDNTWATPLFFKPFEHGVDVSIHAGTKYIVGHSDAMLGSCTATAEAWKTLEPTARAIGHGAGPDDVYLGQRGLRTMSVRLQRHMENGLILADWFKARPEVELVMHPALPKDPGHTLWKRDFTGASGLFGITLKPCAEASLIAFVDALELFGMGASWGGYESLVLITKPNSFRTARPWPHEGPTLRFHAGLEDPADLIADLTQAFGKFHAAA